MHDLETIKQINMTEAEKAAEEFFKFLQDYYYHETGIKSDLKDKTAHVKTWSAAIEWHKKHVMEKAREKQDVVYEEDRDEKAMRICIDMKDLEEICK